ncbi:MAG: PEP-CTERM sorting domain-containing protein [Lentisphaerae bacterium]|nr:PEP-CTERM sorting domain-containing protein [Lentisphaerota bacterium]
MKYGFNIAALAVAGCVVASSMQAGIIYEEDFVANPGVVDGSVWDAFDANYSTPPAFTAPDADSVGTETYDAAGGNPAASGEAQVSYTSGIGVDVDRLTTTDAGFLGDYSSALPAAAGHNQELTFDFFWAETDPGNNTYSGLQVYFTGNGITWYYGIDTSGQAENTWATYGVSFAPGGAGWTDTGAGGAFDTDKTLVTEIGFRFAYITSTDNTFAFDNVRRGYNVPEPETYAAIAAALIGLCMVSRKRLAELLGPVARMPWAA